LATGFAVATAIAAQFTAIGTGLAASIVGAAFAPPFFAAAAIVEASGAASMAIGQGILSTSMAGASGVLSGALAFASGGIVTGPTLGLMGEAGSPEAAIPLNDRGAAFMQKTLGLGGAGGNIRIELRIDSKTIAEAILPAIPGAYKLHARGI